MTTGLLIAFYVLVVLLSWYLILLGCYLTLKYLRHQRGWADLQIAFSAPIVLIAWVLFWPLFYVALAVVWLSRRMRPSEPVTS